MRTRLTVNNTLYNGSFVYCKTPQLERNWGGGEKERERERKGEKERERERNLEVERFSPFWRESAL
jgi:hypothetical protein